MYQNIELVLGSVNLKDQFFIGQNADIKRGLHCTALV